MELVCPVQNYHWGKKGSKSLVKKFAERNSGLVIDDDKPCAEFWMGTHPNGEAQIKDSKELLSNFLNCHPQTVGAEVVEEFSISLPFLFKILSVEEPLSIQAHPTKEHAEELHKKFPKIYKDKNHKPELAIAITEFEALCGFRPVREIKYFLNSLPEFRLLIDEEKIKKFNESDETSTVCKKLMKDCFQSLMLCDENLMGIVLDKLLTRLETEPKEEFLVPLVKRIYSLFPKDVGVLCVYWLNYITLAPGQALYLAPNEPHAYLNGDCIECMANSDNVVRAGLTPKFRDVETLCEMLSYENHEPEEILFQPKREDEFCLKYSPPVKDFAVSKITLESKGKYNLIKRKSGSILIVLSGCGKLNSQVLEFGKVFFIPRMSECCIESDGNLVLYQAFCNL